ncbi:peptidase, M23 family [Porphyromonas sp. oral taxon 279 str. F0450]|uniref:murein hydrolase activator EnvC family protein n=1 Tax=Porphyromonas sp. oral taxon 279 TaxID=712438 RepID=UPI00027C674C|nr:peptidoglycan DD-metalloendopeptidase family protein [Porphyromonas sp. oral taxon 279]EJU15405.1 peptidase, M23 family [Porphyromonas sp. oral taxon 279 str. F0450]
MIAYARHQLRHCLTLALLLASSLLALTPEAAAQGRKSKTLQRLEQERKQLLRSIEASDKKLQQLRRDTRNEEQTLRTVKEQVEQRRQVVAVLGNEVSGLQARIDTLSGHIGRLHRREGALLLRYRAALVQLQRIDTHIDPVLFVLSSQNPAEARERQRFLSRYSKAVREASVALRTTRAEIEATKAEVGRTHSEKEQLLSLREAEKKKLEAEEQQRTAQVKDLQGKQQVLAQDLSKQKKRAEDLDHKIQAQVEAEIIAAQRRAAELQRRREEARRRRQTQPTPPPSTGRSGRSKGTTPPPPPPPPADDEPEERRAATPGGYAMDANERALASSFAQNKGRLPAPIRGSYSILRTFGVHQHSEHNRVQVNSSGVDFGVNGDSRAYAVFSGVVSRVFVIPGYGTAVILRHGNYLTVYANLSSVAVSTGSRVSTGQGIGSVGASPDGSSGRLLHFQLWHERTKLNPLAWIKR